MSEWHLLGSVGFFSGFSHRGHKAVVPNPDIMILFKTEGRREK